MNRRRIARRIASMIWRQNASADAVNVRTLATKVFHWSLQSFWLSGRGGSWLVVGVEQQAIIGRWEREWSPAGVWQLPPRSAARRVASKVPVVPTPSTTPSLVTKKGKDRMKHDG
jgi:hypothetical protein